MAVLGLQFETVRNMGKIEADKCEEYKLHTICLGSRIFSSALLQISWYFTSRKYLYECVKREDAWETILSLPNIRPSLGSYIEMPRHT